MIIRVVTGQLSELEDIREEKSESSSPHHSKLVTSLSSHYCLSYYLSLLLSVSPPIRSLLLSGLSSYPVSPPVSSIASPLVRLLSLFLCSIPGINLRLTIHTIIIIMIIIHTYMISLRYKLKSLSAIWSIRFTEPMEWELPEIRSKRKRKVPKRLTRFLRLLHSVERLCMPYISSSRVFISLYRLLSRSEFITVYFTVRN